MWHNFSFLLKPKPIETLDSILWFHEEFYLLLIRFGINLLFITVLIRYMYYPKTKRKDYLFTYFLIGIITFFLCFGLRKLDIDTGMGLGLFAIFGILRYRTDAIEIKEMTYLFLIIGISVINALATNRISVAEVLLMNAAVIGITFGLEYVWLLKHETRKTVLYERIDLIRPENHEAMKADLESRLGLKINRVEIGKVDFLRDVAQVMVFYYASDQTLSDYTDHQNSANFGD